MALAADASSNRIRIVHRARLMTPRPLHRSKTLWFGILILASLLWIWARGRNHYDFANFRIGARTWHGISSSGGYLWYTHQSNGSGSRLVEFASFPLGRSQDWFPTAFKQEHGKNPLGTRYTDSGIAHWLFILLFLIPWAALLTWRSNRLKSLAAAPIPPTE